MHRVSLAVMLALSLVVVTPVGAEPRGPGLARLQGDIAAARTEVERLHAMVERQSAAHEQLVERIVRFRAMSMPRFTIEALQRSARAMAEALDRLQAKEREARARLDRVTARARRIVQARLAALEAARPESKAARLRWIDDQARLLAFLATLEPGAGTLPRIPDASPGPTDGPEELSELADELSDVRDRYQDHAKELARKIAELERRRRLLKMAEEITRDQGLFDESMRYRKVGVVTKTNAPEAGVDRGAAPGRDGSSGAEVQHGGGREASLDDSPAPDDGDHGAGEQNGPAAVPGGGPGEPEAGGSEGEDGADGWFGGDQGEEGGQGISEVGQGGDSAAEAEEVPSVEAPGLEGGGGGLTVHLTDDPGAEIGAFGDDHLDDLDLEHQIELLRRKEAMARHKVEELDTKVEELERRAEAMRQEEGL